MISLRRFRIRKDGRPDPTSSLVGSEGGAQGEADEPVSALERSNPPLSIEEIHRLLLHPLGGKPTDPLKVGNAQLAEILVRAYRNEALTVAENLRLETFYICGISDMARAFRDMPREALPLNRWRQIHAADARFRKYWEQKKTELNALFVSFFEEAVVQQVRLAQRENP